MNVTQTGLDLDYQLCIFKAVNINFVFILQNHKSIAYSILQ